MTNEPDNWNGQQKINGDFGAKGECAMASEPDNWGGQQKINGKLCRVDWMILEALSEASRLLSASGADTRNLDALISQADEVSAQVALEQPPGCFPADRTVRG